MKPNNDPKRRVGSFTLGLTFVAFGICFLLYYFWPGFDYLLALKLSPLLLVALGAETLFFSARPELGRIDLWSVLGCLFLMCACACMATLPLLVEAVRGEIVF